MSNLIYKPLVERWELDGDMSEFFYDEPDVAEFHLQGLHDQKSHGNENAENDGVLVKEPAEITNGKNATQAQRVAAKIKIMQDVAVLSGLSESSTRAFVTDWAESNSNHGAVAAAVHQSVEQVFKSPTSEWQKSHWSGISQPDIEAHKDEARAFVKGVYKNTQKWFAEKGYSPNDEILIYRGLKGVPKDGDYKYEGNAIESWTPDVGVSRMFGKTLRAKVKIKDIYSTALTGQGCLTENEIIVFGGRMKNVEVFDGNK